MFTFALPTGLAKHRNNTAQSESATTIYRIDTKAKLIRILGCFLGSLTALSVQAQAIYRTVKKLPDTGQYLSYTNTYGEDHDYNTNPPKLALYGKGMVYDSVTTLVWQQGDGGEMTWQQAKRYCDTLTLGGFNDWILPNPYEAFTILNLQNPNPALDTKLFSKTGAEYWYTSFEQINDTSKVWVINAGGGVGNHPKAETISMGGTKKFHVRAMRYTTNPQTVPQRFTDNGNGTVTDNLTDLMWVQVCNSATSTWEDAILLSEYNTTAGYSDWRLPNIKELHSLNDEKRFQPSVNSTAFPNLPISKFWSSTTLQNQSTKAWYYDNQYGITTYDVKSALHYVMMVRDANATSGIESLEARTTQHVGPNPYIQGTLHLPKQAEWIEIRNAMGQLLMRERAADFQKLENLSNGSYFLTMLDAELRVLGTQSLIKNH